MGGGGGRLKSSISPLDVWEFMQTETKWRKNIQTPSKQTISLLLFKTCCACPGARLLWVWATHCSQSVFAVADPNRWNNLPENIQMAQATEDLKSLLETHICAVSGAQYLSFWWWEQRCLCYSSWRCRLKHWVDSFRRLNYVVVFSRKAHRLNFVYCSFKGLFFIF